MNRLSPTAGLFGASPFQRVSLARQFLLAGALVLLLGVGATGTWVGRQIEASEVERAAQYAAVYVQSILEPHLDGMLDQAGTSADTRRVLDGVFVDGPLARVVVRFKLWTPDGRIRYSSLPGQDQQVFPLDQDLVLAFAGQLQSKITPLEGSSHHAERERWQRLIEVYVPLRDRHSGQVNAVAEFYHSMQAVELDIRRAQRQSWIAISCGALLLFSGLYALVHRASSTIQGQRSALHRQLADVQRLLRDNHAMNLRLQQAGAQTTSMSELALRRIAADLHDGPAQSLALALLTLDERLDRTAGASAPEATQELERLRATLQQCMRMVREIANGLVVPGMSELALADVVRRAANDTAFRGGVAIDVRAEDSLGDAPEAVKITAYRVVQEALSNSLRHASGCRPRVAAWLEGLQVIIEVADDGPGFDAGAAVAEGHMGLAFLRERVQLIGGTLEIRSTPGTGTVLRAGLPTRTPQAPHEG